MDFTTNGIEEQIVAIYSKGMSTRDIEDHMKKIYRIDVSPSLVSRITDKIMPVISEWQNKSLDTVYPVVFLDAIYFKVRKENRIISKAAYSVVVTIAPPGKVGTILDTSSPCLLV